MHPPLFNSLMSEHWAFEFYKGVSRLPSPNSNYATGTDCTLGFSGRRVVIFFIDGGHDVEEALGNLTSPSASDAASLSDETRRHGRFDATPSHKSGIHSFNGIERKFEYVNLFLFKFEKFIYEF